MIHSHEPWQDAEQLGLNTNRRVNFPAGADVKKSQDAQKSAQQGRSELSLHKWVGGLIPTARAQ
jgi:hypothetical protein